MKIDKFNNKKMKAISTLSIVERKKMVPKGNLEKS